MDKYQTTFNTWNKLAILYQEKFMRLDIYNDGYDIFCERITIRQANILEIGCGPGNITQYLLAKENDFKITGIDVAENMIELARINNPSANFIQMDCRDIGQMPGEFDGIVCGFCIPYLAKTDLENMIRDISVLSHPNAILYISYIEGFYEASGFEQGSTGDGSYVYYYDQAYISNLLQQNNFGNILFMQKEFKKNDESIQIHSIAIAEKW